MRKNTPPKQTASDLAIQFAEQVRFYRTQQRLTQAELASRAGVTVETVARVERILRGRPSANANPSLETMGRIAESLGVDLVNLISRKRTKPTSDRIDALLRDASPELVQRATLVIEALVRDARLAATAAKRKAA